MAMFSFDEQAALFDVTPLPNQFILNYLPEASGDAVRVYLFGLVACYHHEAISDLQQMARELNMTEDDIRAAYRYWERKGLVQRVADNPPQYRYQNIYQVMMTGAQAQIDPAYEQFAEAIYGVFDNDRRLHGKDVSQCYEWVEQMRLPPDVVIAMMRHMVQKHGKNVSMKKAEQMAMRLADEKVQTVEEAQEISGAIRPFGAAARRCWRSWACAATRPSRNRRCTASGWWTGSSRRMQSCARWMKPSRAATRRLRIWTGF